MHSLDLRVEAGAGAAAGAVALLDDLAAGVDSADDSAHDGDFKKNQCG